VIAGSGGAEGRSGAGSADRGSVIAPVRALAAAVAGEQRYTASSAVPLRPGKLRLKVRSDGRAVTGACPMPTHGPHTGSSIRAPASARSRYTPDRMIVSRICRDPGVTVSATPGATAVSRSAAATVARSWYELFTDDPTQTCTSGVPATSPTGTTVPGEGGSATNGSNAARSMRSTSS
jgi:hypothetical protein